jgi:hypothetical protein
MAIPLNFNFFIYASWLIKLIVLLIYFHMFQDLVGLSGDELAQFMPTVGEK